MIDNKFLRSIYNRLAIIFHDKEHHVDSQEEADSKLQDKIPILNREARAILSLIECNNKIIECTENILKEHEYNIDFLKMRRESLLLAKENVKLDLEYYGKMDFMGEYSRIIKLSKETTEFEFKSANENILRVVKELEDSLAYIPDGAKEKILTIAMLHQHYSGAKTLTNREFTELYKRLIDMAVRNRQYIEKKEYEETHITV